MNDLDGDAAAQTAREIGGETAVFACDLTADGGAEELVGAAADAFGKIDIVVNNAGYTSDGIAHRMSDDQFRAMLEIHTVVPFKVLRQRRRSYATQGRPTEMRGARCSARW